MIAGFELYTPEAWSDVRGLIVRGKPHKVSAHPQQGKVRRSGNKWNIFISKTVGAAHLVISSLLLSTSYSAVAIAVPTLASGRHDLDVVRPKSSQTVALSPIRDINQSFNKLFDSVRTGQMLIPSESVRLLAQKALQSQKEGVDIDSWARNLANDIKVAND